MLKKIRLMIARPFRSVIRFIALHQKLFTVFFLAMAVVFPFLTSNRYILRLGTLCLMYSILTLGLNLVTGYMGQMSFGQAAFWGIGSYTAALLVVEAGFSTIPAMLISIVVSGFFGYLVALPSLKLKGYYLTIVTMGFCEIIRLVELNSAFTGGSLGIPRIPSFTFFGLTLKSPREIYFIALVLVILVTVFVKRLVSSTFGLAIKSIRDDDEVAETMGINIVRTKRITFVLSAMIAGLAGAFYAQYITFIHPSIYTIAASQELIVMIILGGLGSLPGTFFGAIVLTLLPELMRDLMEYRMFVYGLLMVVMMIVKPDGLLGNFDFGLIRDKALEEGAGRKGKKWGKKEKGGQAV